MDWTAFAIGAIPSLFAVITVVVQVIRDRRKDEALANKTRAEAWLTEATAADTITVAAERLIRQYEKTIAVLEASHECEIQALVQAHAVKLTQLAHELARINSLYVELMKSQSQCDGET